MKGFSFIHQMWLTNFSIDLRTLAALSATGQPKYHEGFTYGGSMVPGFQYVTYNDQEELIAMVEEMNKTPAEDAKVGR